MFVAPCDQTWPAAREERSAGHPIVGLPGNPAAVYVTLALFVRPRGTPRRGDVRPLVPQAVRSTFKAKTAESPRIHQGRLSRAADGVFSAEVPQGGADC